MVIKSNRIDDVPISSSDELRNPFGQLGVDLSDSELREMAYEVLVGACRSTGGKPLTYISQSQRTAAVERSSSLSLSSGAPSLQRSLTSTAASKVKKALGLKKKSPNAVAGQNNPVGSGKGKKPVTVGELVRIQMRVSEQTDSRIRRGLLRIAAGQLGRRIESMVLPLELLQQFKSSDFPNQQEYEVWQNRNLKILEAGLLLHPHMPLDKADTAPQRLRQIIRGGLERPIETGKQSESMQVLRSTVMSLACRSFDGSTSETCHWADGVPFNLRLYQMLLEACFDVNEETSVVEEVDEVLELIKKTWVVLGINQMLHNLCFSWVLFHRFVATGQVENDLLFAANNLLAEVENDAKATKDSVYSTTLSSTLSRILRWAEKSLLAYHDTFYSGNIELMQIVVSLAVISAKILVDDISNEYRKKRKEVDVACDRVDNYIRSSVRSAFAQKMETVKSSKRSSKNQQNPLPVLSILAQDLTELALNEKEIYSPIMKRWHPLAAGTAVATLHACYGNELKQFVSDIDELSPDAVQVLLAADKLEKVLVQIAVEDSVESEDGGKAIIQEMAPYEAETVITSLVKVWIRTRVDRLKEWVDRNLQQEVWNPQANKERFAPSAIEVLRTMDETIEAFFLLPIIMHPNLLPDLMNGLDRCLQQYVLKAKSGCGTQSTFIPPMPALTRCKTGSKLFKKKEKSYTTQRRKPQVGTTNRENSIGIPQLCVRINTLQHIRTQLEVLGKKIINHLRNSKSAHVDDIANRMEKKFELSAAACVEGIQQLCEVTAHKVVFHDLSHVLWDGLYVGDVSSSRIEPFLQELEQHLVVISATVHDRVRTRVITDVMKTSFEGFLFVLLAGGPSRAFTLQDSHTLEEDFKFLMDLFWSNGDGLPAELIDKLSTTVKGILPLFRTDTESLIEQFRRVTQESFGFSSKSRLPLPETSGQWSPAEPNTLLRVLCYRNDDMATKFLKKTYNLPKKL
ncbi:protein unc-13 homolog isoform X1 [Camellia sinensis]|uniref:protein unc-13 homolog isoform X1 n=1 Tax=Camellia sinensis TaxID=4442 RepID=UPI00103560B9|nr:protein unc-13 homolog isoform X1 [Camellia sinensis]